MKTKTIFKALALAMMMPAMMLPTACSNDNDVIVTPENDKEGYALPVTINVTREGDATTRAEYNDGTKTLAFSTGDKLFVAGTDATAGQFAGTLTWVSEGTFTGTIYTQYEYTGTADALLGSASTATATLLPDGYDSFEYLTVSGDGYGASLATDATKAFATSKAAAVEQLSLEKATAYSSGFALAPQNAILNFTAVTGEWGSGATPASSSVSLQAGETTVSGSVAPVQGDYARALANFAIAVAGGTTPSLTLTVDGTSVSLGSHALTAGKIYNQKCANINAISPYIQANEKWLVYGTGASSGWQLSVAEGATVTLSNVNLSGASIVYMGNNTIILADGTTNTVTVAGSPAIFDMMASGKSLTIKGTGSLNVTGGYGSPAIGPMGWDQSCGNITIESTVHLTATAGEGQSKAITTNGGGTLTIGGVVYPDGADSPFVYPIPAPSYTMAADAASGDVGKLICTDGHIHAYGEDAECTATRVAKIIYVGINTDNTTYTHGLALALADEDQSNWSTAVSTCAAKNTSTPVAGAYWMLPSRPQWEVMGATEGSSTKATLRDGFSDVGGTNMQENVYWSSTEIAGETQYVYYYWFGDDYDLYWMEVGKNEASGIDTRACLAF